MNVVYELLDSTGGWGVLVGGLGVVSLFGLVAMVALRATGRRVPALFWWIGPAVVVAVGLLGTGVGLETGEPAPTGELASYEMLELSLEFVTALDVIAVAAIANTVLCLVVGLGVGVGVYRTRGPDGSYGIPKMAPAIAAAGVVVIALLAVTNSPVPTVTWIAVVGATVVAGTIGCMLANFGAATPDRTVDRYTVALGLVGATISAVGAAGWASVRVAVGLVSIEQLGESGSSTEVVDRAGRFVELTGQIGIVAVLVALIVGALFVAESRETAVAPGVLKSVGTGLLPGLVVVAGGVLVVVQMQEAPFVSALYQLLEAGS